MRKVYSLLCMLLLVGGLVSCSDDDAPKPSGLNSIENFSIDFGGIESVSYEFGDDIAVSVPFGTSLAGLVTTVEVSENATVAPASGTAVDYSDGEAVDFTVTAENGDVKIYPIIVTIRGEVGSGSRLNTYQIEDLFGENSTTTYEYSETSGFVTKYIVEDVYDGTTNYELVYDDKNQVIERKSSTSAVAGSLVYGYNDNGQIINGEYTEDGVAVYSYTYDYNASGTLIKITRVDHKDDDFESAREFKVENGNVVEEIAFGETSIAAYDDKNNPFRTLYPAAYAAIHIGIHLVNVNNPVSGTLSDNDIVYEYNDDDYPISAAYTYFDGFATVNKTYTYFE